MTPSELRGLIAEIGWTQAECARYARRDTARMHKMARGTVPIDKAFEDWLRAVHRLLSEGIPLRRSDNAAGDHLPAAGQPPPG